MKDMVEERRGRPRFLLRLPLMLKVYQGTEREILGTTDNVSLTGILLSTDTEISLGTHVELTIALIQPATPPYKLLVSNTGRVVRVEMRPAGRAIAIECD